MLLVSLSLISCLNASRKKHRISCAPPSGEAKENPPLPRDATGCWTTARQLELRRVEHHCVHCIEKEKGFKERVKGVVVFSLGMVAFSTLTKFFMIDAADPALPYIEESMKISACCVVAGSYILKDSYDRVRRMNKRLKTLKSINF